MRVAICGQSKLGGVAMRGVAVAARLGIPFIDVKDLRRSERWDVLLLVKYWQRAAVPPREVCARLVFDPLDCWSSLDKWYGALPRHFWRWCWKQVRFDEIVATSPACHTAMKEGLPRTPVHILPHHADPRIGPDWHDPGGPVVYAGAERFIAADLPQIRAACRHVGRELIVDSGRDCWKSLQGASLALHLRLPPHDTPLNRRCRPQVKAENAAAAGLPLLATPDRCLTSQRPSGILYREQTEPRPWGVHLQEIIEAAEHGGTVQNWPHPTPQAVAPLTNPVTLDQHAEALGRILGL